MKAAVADRHYRTICLRIVPVTGSPIYLTRHPRDLVMGGHTYLSGSGYDFTGYSAEANLSPAMIDLEGVAGLAGIGYAEIATAFSTTPAPTCSPPLGTALSRTRSPSSPAFSARRR